MLTKTCRLSQHFFLTPFLLSSPLPLYSSTTKPTN